MKYRAVLGLLWVPLLIFGFFLIFASLVSMSGEQISDSAVFMLIGGGISILVGLTGFSVWLKTLKGW